MARAEIDRAEMRLGAILGRRPLLFAYPAGEADPAVEADVEAAGIELAVGSQEGALETLSNRFLVPRVRVSPGMSAARLLVNMDTVIAGRLP
jgi:peptidoglycan/xylan/chitin deacetylase (PgdA/CDA1 family)